MTAWEKFVVRHTKPGNLWVHALSSLLFFGCPILALVMWSPWPLIGFGLSGVVGAAGHRVFDDGEVSVREGTSQPEVPVFVVYMFWRILRGKYREDVARAREKLASERASG